LEDENLDYSVGLKNSVHFLVVYVYIYVYFQYTGFFLCAFMYVKTGHLKVNV